MDLVTGGTPKPKQPKGERRKKGKNSVKDAKRKKVAKKGSGPRLLASQSSSIIPKDSRPKWTIPIVQHKINWYDKVGATPLFWAVSRQNLPDVQHFIAENANVNEPGNHQHHTPLERAIQLENQDIIGLLLLCGAFVPPSLRDRNYCSAVEQLKEKKRAQLEQLLGKTNEKNGRLKLDFFFFDTLPQQITNWKHITTLQLRHNNLTHLPVIITELTNLTILDISYNLLSSLPPEINRFKELKIFSCSFNYLTKFPKIQDLNQITELYLSHNQIPAIHKVIANLFRLIRCDLSHNFIVELPKFLADLSGMQFFNVSHNSISSVIDFPFQLFNALRILDISYNFISQLPYQKLFDLKIPENLYMRGNRFPIVYYKIMKCFYAEKKSLSSKVLNLSQSQLFEVPPEISVLSHITHLDLSHNQLTVLPTEMSSLVELTYLDLSYNQIEVLPFFFHRFSKLKTLVLEETQKYINDPPKPITQDWISIKRYFDDLLEGEPCYRTKLMVVGQENVGKSTVLHAMRQQQKKQKVKRSNISTDGIDIAQWVVNTKIDDKKIGLTFSAWDFAGQEIYYATHSFFISSKAIYLIIWDLRYPTEEARVTFWLNSVESKASNAPVILVGTHYDDAMFQNNPTKATEILTEVSEKYCRRYPNIKGVIAVSATEHAGIDQLMSVIEKTALSMPNILDKLPKIYQNLEDVIIREKDVRSPPAVTWGEFRRDIAGNAKFKDEDHLLQATEFLNNLGSLVYFAASKDTSEALVVLDPQWLTSMFASIITTSHNYTQHGVLKKTNIPQIWRAPQYPPKMHKTMIELLEKFEIMFELPSGDSNETIYLIPSLLPEERPPTDLLWPAYDTVQMETEFNRSYEIEFVPNGLFSRLMIRFLHFVDKPLKYWRNGIIGQRGNSTAIVELMGNSISYSTRGESSAEFLRVVNEIVDTLVTDWFKVRIKSITIRCPHCIANRNPEPFIFEIADCEHCAAVGNVRTIDCRAVQPPFPIRLDRVVPDIAMADFDGSLIDYKDIVIEKTLGKGSFGVIYRGRWKGDVVAVKQLKVEGDMALEAYAEFRKEVWLMSGLDHPCIVNLLGYSTNPLVMVMECVTGGDLYGLVHNPKIDIDWHVRLKISLDMAYGMEFLHSINPPLLHRDLKSPNVLVMNFTDGAKVIAKVADFGLSSRLFINSLQNRAVENPTWCAPEVMVRKMYTEKADVYPFGIMMWELLTREHPYDNYRFQYQVEDDVLAGVRPEIPSDCWPDYAELMTKSWDPDPDKRPTFKEILAKLLSIIKNEIGVEKFRYAIDPCEGIRRLKRQGTITMNSPLHSERVDVKIRGELMKEIFTELTVTCIAASDTQVWCGTSDGFIVVFSAISGLLITTYISPGYISSLFSYEKRIWSGGDSNIGIWEIEDRMAKEEDYSNTIKSGTLGISSSPLNPKLKFKKGVTRFVTLTRDGHFSYYGVKDDQTTLIEKIPLKGARFEIKSRAKGRFFLICDGCVLCIQCTSETELDSWLTELTASISMCSSYPSNLVIVKKLPVGDEQIQCFGVSANKLILLGLSNSTQIRSVDSMLRSKPPIILGDSLVGKVTVNNILTTANGLWITANNRIVKIHPRSHTVQLVLQEVHQAEISHMIKVELELWSCAGKEICCWDIKNGTYLHSIKCEQTISCLLAVGSTVWAGGDPSIYIFQSQEKTQVKEIVQHKSTVRGMEVVSSNRVWSFSENGQICIWS